MKCTYTIVKQSRRAAFLGRSWSICRLAVMRNSNVCQFSRHFLRFSSIVNPSFALCLVRVFLLLQAQRFVGTADMVFVDSRALVARMQLSWPCFHCVHVCSWNILTSFWWMATRYTKIKIAWDKGGSVWPRIVAQR